MNFIDPSGRCFTSCQESDCRYCSNVTSTRMNNSNICIRIIKQIILIRSGPFRSYLSGTKTNILTRVDLLDYIISNLSCSCTSRLYVKIYCHRDKQLHIPFNQTWNLSIHTNTRTHTGVYIPLLSFIHIHKLVFIQWYVYFGTVLNACSDTT